MRMKMYTPIANHIRLVECYTSYCKLIEKETSLLYLNYGIDGLLKNGQKFYTKYVTGFKEDML